MKVLFAVNNDDISNAIVKKYQKDYKEILSYKSVYYFNAIFKELQKDKTYDRVVISEDLEPFANNNYDAIDKFLFDKLDNISDEAINERGKDTDIILICTDRRNKADDILVKLFGIGIYNAIIGQDRSIDEVCKLINRPRTKKDAKLYYKIDAENVNYQSESEDNVSEAEVQNILAHYKRLGRNEDKYVESFNNIVSQYNDNQLKIIIRYLPIGVKAVLEENSPKYQELVNYSGAGNRSERKVNSYNSSVNKQENTKQDSVKVKMLENQSEKRQIRGPVVIPSGINKSGVKKLIEQDNREENIIEELYNRENAQEDVDIDDIITNDIDEIDEDVVETNEIEEQVVAPKRGRGRPRKIVPEGEAKPEAPKRGRGRPKKVVPVPVEDVETEEDEDIDLFGLDDDEDTSKENNTNMQNEDIDLFSLDDEDNSNDNDNNDEDLDLFNLDNDDENEEVSDDNEDEVDLFGLDNTKHNNEDTISNEIAETNYKPVNNDFSGLISKDKKIVSFVGTTKNGTSFVVNNVAHLLASRGIKTAILDMTKTRNAYYIYTNSDERLIEKAKNCIYKLRSGVTEGIEINKNLSVYTSIPEDDSDYSDVNAILGTLIKNYSVVLIDCDFDTPMEYFDSSQETYLVQSMDVLTMQPLTAFLRNLQSKGILKEEKLRVVINKGVNIKSVSIKTLIGGISKYNDPSMTYMKDLFNKDNIRFYVIPFELPNYIKYLDSVITCQISLNGYTKPLIAALNELGNIIYPILSNGSYSPRGEKYKDNFTNQMNDTLNKMKRKYQ
ncbi:MAG: hypothetical protein J5507_03360 [Clostridia bacterium]|nr:hypothetical protein [Clostridia bacterium]